MNDESFIPCIIYAAKSTEDKRGSIPDQVADCEAMIVRTPERTVVAQYTDEAFSAFRRDRGPGLREAMSHVEALAAERPFAELWAQHSDRLARGDGLSARHTVEIALWAIKRNVKVRTVQDANTFRDLLYAVVTGERNNEDSKRKALACQAGRRRAIARGEYIGHLPDGYRVVVEVDDRTQVTKRMILDPERQALIELIFRLALRGRNCGQIAASVNNVGWRTKPVKRAVPSAPFDVGKIYEILRNPRYAALATWKGTIVARGYWPAYISERQHERIKRQLLAPRPRHGHKALDAYLLSGVGCCGSCGKPLCAHTSRGRVVGLHRHYLCSSYAKYRGALRCKSRPLDAHTVEAMVVASIGNLLATTAADADCDSAAEAELNAQRTGGLSLRAMRERLGAAYLAGDEESIDETLELLFAAMQADAALVRGTAISRRLATELEELTKLRTWIEQESHGRTDTTRAQTRELNALLRRWFTSIAVTVHPASVAIEASRRAPASSTVERVKVLIDRASWARRVRPHQRQLVHGFWERADIIGALQAFADREGRSPTWVDWECAGSNQPQANTVYRHFKSWNHALRAAGLETVKPPSRHKWEPREIVNALRAWTDRYGRVPMSSEWSRASQDHPSSDTVRAYFGLWDNALRAAALEPPRRLPRRNKAWVPKDILEALRRWTEANGRPPSDLDWARAAPNHPHFNTVRRYFGSVRSAVATAGLDCRTSTQSVTDPSR